MGAYVDASFKFYSFIGVRLFYELNTGIELSDQIVLLSVSWRMGAYVDASFKFYSFIGVRLFLCAEDWLRSSVEREEGIIKVGSFAKGIEAAAWGEAETTA